MRDGALFQVSEVKNQHPTDLFLARVNQNHQFGEGGSVYLDNDGWV